MALTLFKSLFSRRYPISLRLWRGGGLLAIFVATLFAGNLVIPKDRSVGWQMLGHDFLPFYYGGTCVFTGHYEQLFDLPATRGFEFKTGHAAGLELGTSFGPWWNPPFAAWMFAPLASLPYLQALHVWWAISAVCLTISIALLCSMLIGGWQIKLLVPFLMLMAMPCFQAFCHGQNTFVSLLLLTTTVWLWRKNQPLLAGIVSGLLFYKPQLGATIAAILCLHQGRRAILGVCLTGTALVVLNVLYLPGTLHEFVYHMPLNLHWIQEENPYRWERHVTLKALWRLAFQGDAVGSISPIARTCWLASEAALAAGLGFVLIKSLFNRTASQRDRLICLTIAAMPLLMPFYFDYDSLLLAVGIVVYAADRQRGRFQIDRPQWEDRAVVATWATLYLVTGFYTTLIGILGAYAHPGTSLAAVLTILKTRINPAIPLLVVAALLLVRRGLRQLPEPAMVHPPRESERPLPTALAA